MMLLRILVVFQIVASAALVLVGSLAEAYGYGLSLGTSWPYRKDIFPLARKGDPEAWHRIIATFAGANALLLAALARDVNTTSGLALIVVTALLGLATLNVLAGKAPAFFHGLHEALAYCTLCAYLCEALSGSPSMWSLLEETASLRALLLMVFLGGMVTGQRGFKSPIGAFIVPRTKAQWMFALHLAGYVGLLLTLAYFAGPFSAAFLFALLQVLLGFALYQSVNARPGTPGIITVFHQLMSLLIFLSLVFAWGIRVGLLG
ncbi:MAG TPA: cytochrome C oxidase assembly protein [Spirochaetia bacterium]|nr:cytochrome C oxidase assembly protein [Spirochaetia bacterium]